MLLRDRLNEFELDWAQAAVRSELIPTGKIRGKKILIVGCEDTFEAAIGWSFAAWNDERKAGVRVEQARCVFCEEGLRGTQKETVSGPLGEQDATGGAAEQRFEITRSFTDETFAPEEADDIILTGFCCRETNDTVAETVARIDEFRKLVRAVASLDCARVLLLSDGRVYGRLGHGFAASEYEAGKTDPCAPGFEAQYLLQAFENLFVTAMRAAKRPFNILRIGLIYGACVSMRGNLATELAAKTASGEEISLTLSREKSSYISIHDALTAIQFVLTKCPENKILNVSGLNSDVTDGELAMLLYDNFPEQCRLSLTSGTPECSEFASHKLEEQTCDGDASTESAERASADPDDLTEGNAETGRRPGIFLNTQLIRHYGFVPSVSLEDGLIILVKSLQNTGEVFIFDNTYLGKLEKVQKILLAYLLEIDRICKKHNIKYFLAGGTLLGAIRHHGFIPWDDDADVMMLREDYDRFLEVAKDELPENIFLQLPHTEKGNYNPFTKLRIDNTMFATEFTGHFLWMHNGIFFDILAHDRTGKHKWSQKLHLMATMLMRSIVFNKWGDTDIAGGGGHPLVCKIVDKVKYIVPMRFALWAQNRLLEFYKNRDTGYLYDGMGRNLSRGSFPEEWLKEVVYVDFEGYQFPVPKEYDKYLTYLYGDYMQMIPVSSRRTSHSIVLMDLGEYSDFHV